MVKSKRSKLYHFHIQIHNRSSVCLNKLFGILHLRIHNNQYFVRQTHNRGRTNELSYLVYFYNTLHFLQLASTDVFIFINSH
jgi:hypothetical protein